MTFTAIETTDDTLTRHKEPARLSCKLENSPKAPDNVVWTNGEVQIEQFSGRAGYSLSVSY